MSSSQVSSLVSRRQNGRDFSRFWLVSRVNKMTEGYVVTFAESRFRELVRIDLFDPKRQRRKT